MLVLVQVVAAKSVFFINGCSLVCIYKLSKGLSCLITILTAVAFLYHIASHISLANKKCCSNCPHTNYETEHLVGMVTKLWVISCAKCFMESNQLKRK